MFYFPVVPICENQRKDVADTHLLNNGLYRECNTYKAGGGYDQFPSIYTNITGKTAPNIENQFVVQLYGCTLNCPYCYVTRQGVFGDSVPVLAERLVQDFKNSGCGTFHLMGGAPATYYKHWRDILDLLPPDVPFHSDFILNEKEYNLNALRDLAFYKNGVYAVSIKGNLKWYEEQKVKISLIVDNMEVLKESGIQYYFTFTGMEEKDISQWKRLFSEHNFSNSFSIPIVEYEALKNR